MLDEEQLRQEINRYKKRHLKEDTEQEVVRSHEYMQFRRENLPNHLSLYEKACNFSAKYLNVKPDPKKAKVMKENLRISHLNVTPAGAFSFSIVWAIASVFLGAVIGLVILNSFFMLILFLTTGLMGLIIFDKLPQYFANNWRLKASNQMVQCIFYVATYMRHTSNLENAIEFAADHTAPPLSLDLKKVLWDVETEEYESIKESLDSYLESWRKWNIEFIEAFHLLEASLLEPSETRRLVFVDKALEVMLSETYEKMLHYTHNLKNPITMLHMMGVILPILGMIILPLIVSFMGNVRWYHISFLYNFILPIMVYFMGKNILSQRPTGYGDTDISLHTPDLEKYKKFLIKIGKFEIKIKPITITLIIGGFLFLIGISPLLIHAISPDFDIGLSPIIDESSPCKRRYCLMRYMITDSNSTKKLGPFGLGAAVISMFVPLAIGIGLHIYFTIKSKKLIKKRNEAKDLEKEFASGLFQLGNRIGDGLPIEIAFGKVAKVLSGTKTGEFFAVVSNNITKMGMSLRQAIFNNRHGALIYFPSKIIESSMKVLMQSSRKGPKICSQALINVSQYIKEIHRVNERLKDLLSDILSSMKSQISFLAPAIAGIVVGITSMISAIISKLGGELGGLEGSEAVGVSSMPELFKQGIPTYFFQIVVGLYVIQIVYILSVMANGIENGSDKLNEKYMVGKNMKGSTLLYIAIATIVTIMFNLTASMIINVT
ncbi:MAG: hypothetical protein MAG795_01153 [Candidatus Woesearchaeota archaeon]|nr:hypothetical protein [Candidatus Woesearchaeota archaeon]